MSNNQLPSKSVFEPKKGTLATPDAVPLRIPLIFSGTMAVLVSLEGVEEDAILSGGYNQLSTAGKPRVASWKSKKGNHGRQATAP
jgi:hypothetical protein